MLRVHQVEHFHLVAMAAEQLRRVCVKLPLAIGDNGRPSPADDIEDGWPDDTPGLARTGCAKHGDVPVEAGVHRQADGFAAPFAQQDVLRFGQWLYGEHFFQLPLPHPGGGAVGALLADSKPPGVLSAAAEAVTELEIQRQGCAGHQQDTHALQPRKGKGCPDTVPYLQAGEFDYSLACHAAGFLPDGVTLQQLPDKAAYINKSGEPK